MTTEVHCGDCLDVLAGMEENSVDAVVTDPPYGLEFMGKEWDRLGDVARANRGTQPERKRPPGEGGKSQKFQLPAPAFDLSLSSQLAVQVWHQRWAEAALRVLKPGGHLVAFGGTRTHHRLWCALEDAGFEVRDTLCWLYGSGFPKSLDVSKAIDKAAGAKRTEIIGTRHRNVKPFNEETGWNPNPTTGNHNYTAPATDAARQWDGWGTALKPAWEPIVLARKPLVGTVAANVQAHGTGALNVDGCRIGIANGDDIYAKNPHTEGGFGHAGAAIYGDSEGALVYKPAGRWPANVVLDEEAAAMLDAQSGELASGHFPGHQNVGPNYHGGWSNDIAPERWLNSGGASRFFYCAKASRAERGKDNNHPTVKPLALMRWLVRLVTPPGGLILDPFVGSGTTALAAVAEGFRCIGIDSDEGYCELALKRLAQAQPALVCS